MSTLEKTYEYFATHQDASGAKAMDVRDVVRAVVPTYPASDSTAERAGFLDGAGLRLWMRGAVCAALCCCDVRAALCREQNLLLCPTHCTLPPTPTPLTPHPQPIPPQPTPPGESGKRVEGKLANEPKNSAFRALDDDGDGVISFAEFRLVVLLLSIPAQDIEVGWGCLGWLGGLGWVWVGGWVRRATIQAKSPQPPHTPPLTHTHTHIAQPQHNRHLSKVVFSVLDLDNSGAITTEEFDVVLSELEKRAGMPQRFHARAGKHDNTGGVASGERWGGLVLLGLWGFGGLVSDGKTALHCLFQAPLPTSPPSPTKPNQGTMATWRALCLAPT